MEKSPIFLGAVGSVDGQTGVSLAVNKEHARQRRALGYLFTNSALVHLEGLTQAQIQKFISKLKSMAEQGQAVNVGDWCKQHNNSLQPLLRSPEPLGYPPARLR